MMVRKGSRGEEGASLVEFALILPIFALLLFGLIDFGLVFGGFMSLRNGVGSGARAASVSLVDPSCTTSSSPMDCTVKDRIGTLVGTTGIVTVTIAFPTGSDGSTGQPGDPVEVCASATTSSSTGITSPFLSGKAIHATSEVRLEQTPSYTPDITGATC